MLSLHPNILERDGKKAFAVLPRMRDPSKALDACREKADYLDMRQTLPIEETANPQVADERKAREQQIAIYRRMTPAQRIEASVQLSVAARKLKAAAVRGQHPDWDEKRVLDVVRETFLYARS